jgi:hypothetical protein
MLSDNDEVRICATEILLKFFDVKVDGSGRNEKNCLSSYTQKVSEYRRKAIICDLFEEICTPDTPEINNFSEKMFSELATKREPSMENVLIVATLCRTKINLFKSDKLMKDFITFAKRYVGKPGIQEEAEQIIMKWACDNIREFIKSYMYLGMKDVELLGRVFSRMVASMEHRKNLLDEYISWVKLGERLEFDKNLAVLNCLAISDRGESKNSEYVALVFVAILTWFGAMFRQIGSGCDLARLSAIFWRLTESRKDLVDFDPGSFEKFSLTIQGFAEVLLGIDPDITTRFCVKCREALEKEADLSFWGISASVVHISLLVAQLGDKDIMKEKLNDELRRILLSLFPRGQTGNPHIVVFLAHLLEHRMKAADLEKLSQKVCEQMFAYILAGGNSPTIIPNQLVHCVRFLSFILPRITGLDQSRKSEFVNVVAKGMSGDNHFEFTPTIINAIRMIIPAVRKSCDFEFFRGISQSRLNMIHMIHLVVRGNSEVREAVLNMFQDLFNVGSKDAAVACFVDRLEEESHLFPSMKFRSIGDCLLDGANVNIDREWMHVLCVVAKTVCEKGSKFLEGASFLQNFCRLCLNIMKNRAHLCYDQAFGAISEFM